MPDSDNMIRITNREVYDAVQGLDKRLASVEHIIGTILNENKSTGGRLRSLELKYYGILAAITATMGGMGLGIWLG